jgi:DnaJ like chaperone protein
LEITVSDLFYISYPDSPGYMARNSWKGTWTGVFVGGLIGSSFLPRVGFLLGAVIGGLFGYQYDKGAAGGAGRAFDRFSGAPAAARQKVFFETVFLAMGRLAKADGRVSEEEIQIARSIMHQLGLGPEDVRVAIEFFTRGKQPDFPLERQLQKLAAVCQGQPELSRAFMEILMEIPLSKGSFNSAERELLWRIASGLGIGRVEMAQLEAILRAQRSFGQGAQAARSAESELAQAYKALGVEASATDKEVKTAYRRLMNQHHPDKLASKGLPESMLEVAKEKTREIRSAYERIRDHRGMR